MANIVITTGTNTIKVDFGVYGNTDAPPFGIVPEKKCYQKADANFAVINAKVYAMMDRYSFDIPVSWDGAAGTYQIDSIDGVAPVSDSDLYTKLIAML